MMVLWLPIGALVAVLGVASIRWTVMRFDTTAPYRSVALAAGGMIMRLALAAAVLFLALRQGPVCALLVFLGLLLGRWAAVGLLTRAGSAPLSPET
jgi:hypothetical protein